MNRLSRERSSVTIARYTGRYLQTRQLPYSGPSESINRIGTYLKKQVIPSQGKFQEELTFIRETYDTILRYIPGGTNT